MKPTDGVIERIDRAARDGDNELLNLLLELVQLRSCKMYTKEYTKEYTKAEFPDTMEIKTYGWADQSYKSIKK